MTCVFRLRSPLADHVALIGTFNNWSTVATPMERGVDGRWQTVVDLPPGEHRYSYFAIVQEDDRPPQSEIVCAGSLVVVPNSEHPA
jgi:1,4-alpha-glucan branching enzyme